MLPDWASITLSSIFINVNTFSLFIDTYSIRVIMALVLIINERRRHAIVISFVPYRIMFKDNYTYPAVIEYEEPDLINISFPDFPGTMTCSGPDPEEFIENAQDLLCLTLCDYLDRSVTPPQPGQYKPTENRQIILVNVWIPYHRSKVKEVYVKKTLTIPAWLNALAQQNNINFSSVLTEALCEKLGIPDRK